MCSYGGFHKPWTSVYYYQASILTTRPLNRKSIFQLLAITHIAADGFYLLIYLDEADIEELLMQA